MTLYETTDPNLDKPPYTLGVFFLVVIFIGVSLLGRLFYLQLIQGDYFLKKSLENRQSVTPVLAPRGVIYDRKSRVLATNKESHSLLFDPRKLTMNEVYSTLSELSSILDVSYEDLIEKVSFRTLAPVYLKRHLDEESVALILENKKGLKGVSVRTTIERFYPENEMAAHTLGYLGQITKKELKKKTFKSYRPGVMIGKNGIERVYDSELKGQDGKQIYQFQSDTKSRQHLKTESAVPGNAIQLTLDKGLQLYCEQILKDKGYQGAIVVLDISSGAILALVSQPAFNPNLFIQGFTKSEWKKLQKADAYPFLNRAVNPYAPGSIFKMVTTLAALEEGYLTAERSFMSRGSLRIAGHTFYDWNRAGFGKVDIYKALAYSIDTVFYELADEMGMDPIEKYAKLFYLGQPTGVGLLHERAGTIPNATWKKKHFKQGWLPGDSVNASIGQGFVEMTPLQAARMTAMIANEGKVIYPHLRVASVPLKNQETEQDIEITRALRRIKPEHWKIVKQGMLSAVQYGTSRALAVSGFDVAGKTGTAETGRGRENHAWIVAYAPAEHPRYAISVFLEHGRSGGGKAAPIGGKVMNYLLKKMGE